MNILRNLVSQLLKKDPIEEIFAGQADQNKFYQAVHYFQGLPDERKRELFKKIHKNLEKGAGKSITLSLLILYDFLSVTNPNVYHSPPEKLFSDIRQRVQKQIFLKKEKKQKGYINFINFYSEFLLLKIWSYKEFEGFNSIYAGIHYFQHAVEAMRLFLKFDFVIQFCLVSFKGNERKLVTIATQNILRRVSQDMQLMIKFVNKWIHVVFQKDNQSFLVNKIYEQLIFIGKNTKKFQYISKKLNLTLQFQKYIIDKDLNAKIEKEMLKRHEQRIKYIYAKKNDAEKAFDCHSELPVKKKLDPILHEQSALEIKVKPKSVL